MSARRRSSHKRRAPAKGRPSSLTSDVADVLVAARGDGRTWDEAAALAGVSARSVERWRAQGEQDGAEGKDTAYWRLCRDLTRARARAKDKALSKIGRFGATFRIGRGGQKELFPGDWRALAFIYDRMFPEDNPRLALRATMRPPGSPEGGVPGAPAAGGQQGSFTFEIVTNIGPALEERVTRPAAGESGSTALAERPPLGSRLPRGRGAGSALEEDDDDDA